MNNVFSLRRFTQLFVSHSVANYRMYLMSFSVLMGILFLGMVYAASLNKFYLSGSTRHMFFTILLFFGGALFTTGIFSHLGDKRKAIAYLMLPASNFEKLLVAWIYSLIIFPLLYTIGFYIVDFLLLTMSKRAFDQSGIMNFGEQFRYRTVLLSFAWIHSVAIFGAVFFRKMHFIKTAFSIFVLITIV
ncbi:MAG: hypothetical protein EOO85_22905, partial [Pedobacter sp.]